MYAVNVKEVVCKIIIQAYFETPYQAWSRGMVSSAGNVRLLN